MFIRVTLTVTGLAIVLATQASVAVGGQYPLQQKLVGADTGYGDKFGSAVAVEGDILIVGAPAKDANRGAIYVFFRESGQWRQTQEIQEPESTFGDYCGQGVALRSGVAMVGCYKSIFVYSVSAGLLTRIAKLDPPIEGTRNFGSQIVIDGNQVLTTAFAGQAFYAAIFSKGSDWGHATVQVLPSPGGAGFSSTGLALQGRFATAGGNGGNTLYVYSNDGTAWTQSQALQGSSFVTTASFCGSYLLAGINPRRADVYRESAGVWSRSDALFAPVTLWSGITNGSFPALVACTDVAGLLSLSGDGRSVPWQVLVYARTGASWMVAASLVAGEGLPDDAFGSSVALSGDTAAIGAPYHDSVAVNAGAVYVYTGIPVASPPCMINIFPAGDASGLSIDVKYQLWTNRGATWDGTFYCPNTYSYRAWSDPVSGGSPSSGTRNIGLPYSGCAYQLQLISTITMPSGLVCTDAQVVTPPPKAP